MTTVYLLRHSKPFRDLLGEYNANEDTQLRNEKNPLSVEGEKLAKEISERDELKNIDVLYSSHYVRTMCTAKYIAENNNIRLNVDERLGERKFGVEKMSDLTIDFFEKQFTNWDYKLENGESLNETSKRITKAFMQILNDNTNKNIAIVSHGTSLMTLLNNWCNISWNNESKVAEIYFDGKMIFDGNWNSPELFKVEFDENNNFVSIINIR